jgi:type IV secretion system protein VirB4
MLALARFQSEEPAMPDLLPYAALVAEGVVQGKDGSLIAGFFFRGEDSASSTNAEKNYITAMVNKYMHRFDAGWCMWVDAARLPSPGYPAPEKSHFPDAITALIDAERREMFEQQNVHYETEYALILQYLPPLSSTSKIMEKFYNDDSSAEKTLGDRLLAEFQTRITDFEEGLKSLLKMRRMGSTYISVNGEQHESDELVNYLHFALTGEALALRIPSNPMFMDAWLGIPDMYTGETPKIGGKFVACVGIDGFPSESYPGILSVLDGLPIAYRWFSRFIFENQHEAISALGRFRRKWQQKIRGFWSQLIKTSNGAIDIDAVAMTQEIDQALGDARSGMVAHGYYTPVVVLLGENKGLVQKQAAYVKKEIDRLGFSARVETTNTVEAWRGSIPGLPFPNVRRPLMHTLNLADLLPLSGIWPGLMENPCAFYPDNSPPLMHTITTGATPFRLNAHVGDNGHVAVFGPVGTGKSTLLSVFAAQFCRYKSRVRADGGTVPATVTAFDKGRSMYTLCSAVGGHHYDIGNDEVSRGRALVLCPLADLRSEKDILWAQEWIENCCMLQSKDKQQRLTPTQRAAVNRALVNMSRETEGRSLTDFVHTVQDTDVRSAMLHYTEGGAMGHLLDGAIATAEDSSFVVYEIDELMKLGDENVIPVLLCLFRRFEKSLTGQPAMLILDEAWMVFRHPVFREHLRKWWKELRKQNCSVVVATQSLSDAVQSGLLDVLVEQCATKIMLPNNEADSHGTKEHPGPHEFYTMFGLNEQEIQQIKNAQYKKDYYYKSDLGRRMFELGLGPLALSFVAVSDKDTLREVRACEDENGGDWPIYWLKKRGVNYEKYLK